MKVYFDMDGVLADFNRGVRELCGMEPSDLYHPDEAHDNLMWEKIREVGDFYYQLKPLPGVAELFMKLYQLLGSGNCQILTAVPKPKRGIVTAGEDKKHWVRDYLADDVVVNVVLREEKKDYISGKNCILIDDLQKNVTEWEEYGGMGILFENAEQIHERLEKIGYLNG